MYKFAATAVHVDVHLGAMASAGTAMMKFWISALKIESCHSAYFIVTGGTVYGAASDDKVGIKTTLGFQYIYLREWHLKGLVISLEAVEAAGKNQG